MAHYQITVDADLVHQLFGGEDGVAKLVESVLNQVLQAQVTEHLKAQHRRANRVSQRVPGAGDEDSGRNPQAAGAPASRRFVLHRAVRTVSAQ